MLLEAYNKEGPLRGAGETKAVPETGPLDLHHAKGLVCPTFHCMANSLWNAKQAVNSPSALLSSLVPVLLPVLHLGTHCHGKFPHE